MSAIGKKLNHKVSRFYLKAWDEDCRDTEFAQIFCLQNGEIRHGNVKNMAAENHFYRLRELNEGDVKLIRELAIADSPESFKHIHEELVWSFSLPHVAKKKLETSDHGTPELLAQMDSVIAEMNENLHTSIEESFKPFLDSMLAGDLRFYSDRAKASMFFRGIAAQYLRTDLVKKAQKYWDSDELETFERIANVLVHIYSINIGYSLYADRDRYKIFPLENPSDVPFITADQPVINIASNPTDPRPPDKFELYYPLSPTKAILLVNPASDHAPCTSSVTAISANVYNLQIAAHSYQQIFGSSEPVLKSVREDLGAFRSCLSRG
jgi:Protein of unknown function (DUF4238)